MYCCLFIHQIQSLAGDDSEQLSFGECPPDHWNH
jgi:hypothetical protein